MCKIYFWETNRRIKNSQLYVEAVACEFFSCCSSDLCFKKNTNGKPYISNFSTFHYNVSHTFSDGKTAIVLAVSDVPVGVDIEKISRKMNINIARRFFEAEEYEYIKNTSFSGAILKIWTKKEAYLKCLGVGLSGNLSLFNSLDKDIHTMIHKEYIISVCNRA